MKRLTALMTSLMLVFCTVAQEREFMVIEKIDGTIMEIEVNEIQRFYFEERTVGSVPKAEEAVDLGLSVKWAPWNVGASTPEKYGGYYAWGETVEKATYNESSYQYYKNDGYVDIGTEISGTPYDVAHVKWRGDWRMPTNEEVQELIDKCTWQYTAVNGVNGAIVTGPNGNSIFLPAAGYKMWSDLYSDGSVGYFWTGTSGAEVDEANRLTFDAEKGYAVAYEFSRWDGFTVRPVIEKEEDSVVISPEVGGTKAEAVDLGLSVKWASWDMGSSRTDEKGKKFYPGDVVGNMDKETAKALQLPWNYCGSEYDIATVNWGDGWRLPNAVDWKELFEKCTWEVIRDIDFADMIENPYFDFVVKVTGPNGNSITFPIKASYDYDSGWSHESWPMTTLMRGGYSDYMCGNNDKSADVQASWDFWGSIDGSKYIEEATLNEYIGGSLEGVYKHEPYDFSFYVRPVMGESTKEYMNISCYLSLKNQVYVKCDYRMSGYESYYNVKERGLCYSTTNENPTIETDEYIAFEEKENQKVTSSTDTLIGPLADETTYYIRAYAKIDGEVFYSETQTITTSKPLPVFTDITEGDLVDLGLHVKWASYNLGAESPEEKGTAVTWDEQARNGWGITTEYIYGTEHDYAFTQLGGDWRMPTYTELCELRDSCEWILGHYNEVSGYKVVGKNGNSVFLPYEMYILSGTCAESDNYPPMTVRQNLMVRSVGADKDCYIRPVQGKPYVELSHFSARYTKHKHREYYPDYNNIRVSVKAYGLEKAEEGRRLGVCYSTEPNVAFSEECFVEVESPVSGQEYIIKINNLKQATTYYYRGVAIIDGVVYYTNESEVSTDAIGEYSGFPGDVAEAVDLGLSVKWSSWNFNGSKPSDKGLRYNLFASMQDQNQNYNHLTDMFSLEMYETPQLYDNITEADEDIVDYAWGNGWRIPTKDEWQELKDNCTWEEATVDNVKGCRVTGKNGNSIFLPYCGKSEAYKDEYIYPSSSSTCYWSATKYHYDNDPDSASHEYYYIDMSADSLWIGESWFGDFMWIRPVKDTK